MGRAYRTNSSLGLFITLLAVCRTCRTCRTCFSCNSGEAASRGLAPGRPQVRMGDHKGQYISNRRKEENGWVEARNDEVLQNHQVSVCSGAIHYTYAPGRFMASRAQ